MSYCVSTISCRSRFRTNNLGMTKTVTILAIFMLSSHCDKLEAKSKGRNVFEEKNT